MACAMQPEAVDFSRKFLAGQLLAFDGERDDERIVAVAAGGDDEAGEPSLAEAAEAQGERLVRLLSELRAAFIIGFVIFVPFLVIDLVVSSALMSMGMMMLPPVMISLPFKLLLFVLVDGWALIITQLVGTYT